jgi:hypothetical protein
MAGNQTVAPLDLKMSTQEAKMSIMSVMGYGSVKEEEMKPFTLKAG